jgi:hypothetical protein
VTSNGTIDHHKPVKYAEAEVMLPPGVVFTVTADIAHRTVTASGICPACGGQTTANFPYGIGGSGSKGWGFRGSRPAVPLPSVRSPATVYCECGHYHADRPDTATDIGCGRFWMVELKLP